MVLVGQQQRWRRHGAGGEIGVKPGLVDVGEERRQLIVLLLTDGIVFVFVTPRALHREAEKCRGKRVGPIGHVFDPKLLRHAAAFDFLRVQSAEGGCQNLFVRGVRQQITRELPSDELVVGKVCG